MMDLQNSDLGAVVRSLRGLYGISQDDLGVYLGLAKTVVCRIESGERALTALEIFDICGYFDIDLSDFCHMADARIKWRSKWRQEEP